MANKRAFVKHDNKGHIVPGSLLVTQGGYPDGNNVWQEIVTKIQCPIPGQTYPENHPTIRKAWVKFDCNGNIVPGSLVMTTKHPHPGIWKEIADICCTTTTTTTTTSTTTTTIIPLDCGTPDWKSPILLFDFCNNLAYGNGDALIQDLSGNGNNGIPVLGTGNGSPETINNLGLVYDAINGEMDYFSTMSGPYQHAIRLPDSMKMAGRVPYTMVAWFKHSGDFGAPGVFQGIYASESRNGGVGGLNFVILSLSGITTIIHQRFNMNTGSAMSAALQFGAGSMPVFTPGTYYMATISYDGLNMDLSLYDGSGQVGLASTTSSDDLSAVSSWGAFLGLRYNNWFNGSIGAFAIYNTPLTPLDIFDIYDTTKARYGY